MKHLKKFEYSIIVDVVRQLTNQLSDEYIVDFFNKEKLSHLDDEDDISYMEDVVGDNIPFYPELQNTLIDIDPYNSVILFELFAGEKISIEPYNHIGKTYNFQETYIREMEDDNESMIDTLKNIDKHIGLNPKIKEEYEEYMHLVDSEKFNL